MINEAIKLFKTSLNELKTWQRYLTIISTGMNERLQKLIPENIEKFTQYVIKIPKNKDPAEQIGREVPIYRKTEKAIELWIIKDKEKDFKIIQDDTTININKEKLEKRIETGRELLIIVDQLVARLTIIQNYVGELQKSIMNIARGFNGEIALLESHIIELENEDDEQLAKDNLGELQYRLENHVEHMEKNNKIIKQYIQELKNVIITIDKSTKNIRGFLQNGKYLTLKNKHKIKIDMSAEKLNRIVKQIEEFLIIKQKTIIIFQDKIEKIQNLIQRTT